jgi:hypothetical protein
MQEENGFFRKKNNLIQEKYVPAGCPEPKVF